MSCIDLYCWEWKDLHASVVVSCKIVHAESPVIIEPVLELVVVAFTKCGGNAFHSDTTL